MAAIRAAEQGTPSARVIVFDHDGGIDAGAQKECTQIFPHTGWAEHEPGEIWASQIGVAVEDANGNFKPMNDLLEEVAGKFAAMPDGIEKNALAIKLFGKAGPDVPPL